MKNKLPKTARWILSRLSVYEEMFSVTRDLEEEYAEILKSEGMFKSRLWLWLQIFKISVYYINLTIKWSFAMFRNYLKIVSRNFQKQKIFSLINILGLSIGIACSILIFMWVQDELKYEKLHKNADNICRVESKFINQPAPLAPTLVEENPEIINAVRFKWFGGLSVSYKDKNFSEEYFYFADNSAFEIFTFTFLKGNPANALTVPNSVVLTEKTAKKYFGDENPIGKSLKIENNYDLQVTGVIKNIPDNTHLKFDLLGSYLFIRTFVKWNWEIWGNHWFNTYILLSKNADYKAVNQKIADTVQKRLPNVKTPLVLHPIKRIHLYRDGAIKYVYIFFTIAVFILIIACINFINLTTAKAGRRAKEIAMRKVTGVSRSGLIKQFLSESAILSVLSFFIAVFIVLLIFPLFNILTEKNLNLNIFSNLSLLLSLIGIVVFTGFVSGIYPAVYMSAFRPIGLLKGGQSIINSRSGGFNFRKILVTFQFIISTGLIICTIIIHNQLFFIKNMNLGLNKESRIFFPIKGNIPNHLEAFKNELKQNNNIINVTYTSTLPIGNISIAAGFSWEGMETGVKPGWPMISADNDFIKTLKIEIKEGEDLKDNMLLNSNPNFILNEKAVKEAGLDSPVGKRFTFWGRQGKIIGIAKNFHFESIYNEIKPLIIFSHPAMYDYTIIRIRLIDNNFTETLEYMKNTWNKYAQGFPFDYYFLDKTFEQHYKSEQKMGTIFTYFTFIVIFISCLGLFGLVSYSAEIKTREIGIRKVFGASIGRITGLLSKEFITCFLTGSIIAFPLAWYVMDAWLSNFVYRVKISPVIFVISALSLLILMIIVTSYQIIKAARKNPADSLRYE